MIEYPDGTFVHDSLDVNDWFQDHTEEGLNLYPGEESDRLKNKEMTQEWFSKIVNFVSLYVSKERRETGLEEYLQALEWSEANFQDGDKIFIGGYTQETMCDLMVLPFFKDAFAMKESHLRESFYNKIDFSKLPKLKRWFDTLSEKYSPYLSEDKFLANLLVKNIEANGPKVQFFILLYKLEIRN